MKIVKVLVLGVILSFTACDEFVEFIVINNSEQKVVKYSAMEYPDTLLLVDEPYLGNAISPSGRGHISYMAPRYRNVYSQTKRDTLSFFILSPDTIAKYGWADVRENYRILKRYDLSFSDVESLDFTIYYPPTNAMRYMKMYPPFE